MELASALLLFALLICDNLCDQLRRIPRSAMVNSQAKHVAADEDIEQVVLGN